MVFTVVMESDLYGRDEFTYATMEEATAAMDRLQAKARELADGVKRRFWIRVEQEENSDNAG